MNTSLLSQSLKASLANFPADINSEIRAQVELLSFDEKLKLESFFLDENNPNKPYQELGETSGQGLWGIDAVREGKKIFQNYSSKLQVAICSNKPVRAYCENAVVIDYVSAAAIVAGALLQAGINLHNLDIASLSVIIVRRGLIAMCASQWQNAEKA